MSVFKSKNNALHIHRDHSFNTSYALNLIMMLLAQHCHIELLTGFILVERKTSGFEV